MTTSGTVNIDRFEIAASCTGGEQAVLRLLKEKGAPIKGDVFLSLDSAYSWERTENQHLACTVFTWRKNG